MTAAALQASSCPHQGVANWPHVLAVGREVDQRNDREGELQAQDHLAENKRRWVDCSPASEITTTAGIRAIKPRDQPPQPGGHPQVEVALHHDLAGERAGQASSSGRRTRERSPKRIGAPLPRKCGK